MAEDNQVARARQQIDAALAALSDAGGDSPTSQAVERRPPALASEAAIGQADIRPDLLRTFTRLVVGTALLGVDELSRRASGWEQQAAQAGAAEARALAPAQSIPAPAQPPDPAPASQASVAPEAVTLAHADSEISLAMIGWVFATQERLRQEQDPGRILQAAGAQIATTTAALIGESLGWSAKDRKARPAAAHDSRMRAWIARGRTEARHSRALARAALYEIVHDVIDALAHEPAIQNLVQSQGTTLAGEVLGEVRERTVSADIYVDSLTRRLFRRARSRPPLDVRDIPTGEIGAEADAPVGQR
jgi:hypothetical protein